MTSLLLYTYLLIKHFSLELTCNSGTNSSRTGWPVSMRITEFEVTMDLMCWKGITSTGGMILIASVHYPMHCHVLAAMPMKYWPWPLYTYNLGGMYLPRVVYIGYRSPYCAILITCTLCVMTEYQRTHPQVPTAYTVHCTWSLTTMQFSLMRRDVSVEKRKSLRCN